jgi:NarL family two-component system response regulator YdfI
LRQRVEIASSAKITTPLIKVFILADSTKELARLTAIVRSNPSLEFSGGSVDPDVLLDQLEDFDGAKLAVVLEHSSAQNAQYSFVNDLGVDRVARIVITEQTGFPDAIAGMKETDSAIRAVLPAWASEKEIHSAIEAVGAGLVVIHPEILAELAEEGNERVTFIPEYSSRELPKTLIQQLSPRESEILNLLAGGFANKEIAWRLKISEHTVKFHITSIFNKLDASTRAEAVAIGARRGLIVL